MLTTAQLTELRQLSIGDDSAIRRLIAQAGDESSPLDERTASLICIGVLIALDPALPVYQRVIQRALDAGATMDEVLAVLLTVAPYTGTTDIVSAAPKMAMALGFDVDAGLEELGTGEDPDRTARGGRG
jgi:4-carboxymuconolactone decarboxylase